MRFDEHGNLPARDPKIRVQDLFKSAAALEAGNRLFWLHGESVPDAFIPDLAYL
jgi:hypothetical protein